jgi:hypothetical protein
MLGGGGDATGVYNPSKPSKPYKPHDPAHGRAGGPESRCAAYHRRTSPTSGASLQVYKRASEGPPRFIPVTALEGVGKASKHSKHSKPTVPRVQDVQAFPTSIHESDGQSAPPLFPMANHARIPSIRTTSAHLHALHCTSSNPQLKHRSASNHFSY